MRWLIDGYNVLHADGRLGPRLGREGFRRARRRFLDDLSTAAVAAGTTGITVVFDAKSPPGDFPTVSTYRGLEVVFALGDENADARIEQLIAEDQNPKTLTVVSSDRRIRAAAARRHTRSLTAEQFWELMDRLKERSAAPRDQPPAVSAAHDLEREPTAEESAFWVEAFSLIEFDVETRAAIAPDQPLLTDADIAELKRRIDAEP